MFASALAGADVPTVSVGTLEPPTLTVTAASIESPAVTLPPVTMAQISTVPGVVIPSDLNNVVNDYSAQLKNMQKQLLDQRSLQFDSTLNLPNSPVWKAWQIIFENPVYTNYQMAFKPLTDSLRIITEVRTPADESEVLRMIRRLQHYQKWGYNAVLVCFDTTERLVDLASAVDTIRSMGLKVVIVYSGGKEQLSEPVFRDPERLRRFLVTLSPRADALLLGWWRTSVHLYLPDTVFTNFIVRTARSAAPDLPVIGQAYWGHSAATMNKNGSYERKTTIALPDNASAVLIMGIGFPNAANTKTLQKLFPEVAGHPHKIALVAGERPYYDTKSPNGRTALDNAKIKRSIELRLLRAGFQSTMTFSGDGSNGNFDPFRTENLCKEYYQEEQRK